MIDRIDATLIPPATVRPRSAGTIVIAQGERARDGTRHDELLELPHDFSVNGLDELPWIMAVSACTPEA